MLDCDVKPSKEKGFKKFGIRLPTDLIERLDQLRQEKKWDNPDKFRTRTHAICAALEEFISNES